jgi:LDH2 family malate/lactate/ureidoglycolate dehydrogenase
MELATAKARASGIGIAAVRNSNHFGIAGYYSLMAAQADMLGVCMTNSEAIGVPTHGRQAMLGTNPIAPAMPADPAPFCFDAATTVVPPWQTAHPYPVQLRRQTAGISPHYRERHGTIC